MSNISSFSSNIVSRQILENFMKTIGKEINKISILSYNFQKSSIALKEIYTRAKEFPIDLQRKKINKKIQKEGVQALKGEDENLNKKITNMAEAIEEYNKIIDKLHRSQNEILKKELETLEKELIEKKQKINNLKEISKNFANKKNNFSIADNLTNFFDSGAIKKSLELIKKSFNEFGSTSKENLEDAIKLDQSFKALNEIIEKGIETINENSFNLNEANSEKVNKNNIVTRIDKIERIEELKITKNLNI